MALIDIKIPQMGEGLTEVRLLELLKAPGDTVARDEILYTMETDKATLEVESPEAGTLAEWLAAEGDVLPIGAPVARIDPEGATVPDAPAPAPSVSAASPTAKAERVVPPRTRAYAREQGLSDADLAKIVTATGKVMPADIDVYLGDRPAERPQPLAEPTAGPATPFRDEPLPERQRKLIFHLKRSVQTVIPGTITRPIDWRPVRDHVNRRREADQPGRPTEFQTFAYCVVQATGDCPKFLCSLVREDTIRHYDHLNVGVAVALPGGELTTAVVPNADVLSPPEFIAALQQRIQAARAGEDQADATVQLLLTYLGAHGIRDAVPVLVAPAAAVLFLGEAYTSEGRLLANMSLTFDHRLMNGVEAAELLAAVAARVEALGVEGGTE